MGESTWTCSSPRVENGTWKSWGGDISSQAQVVRHRTRALQVERHHWDRLRRGNRPGGKRSSGSEKDSPTAHAMVQSMEPPPGFMAPISAPISIRAQDGSRTVGGRAGTDERKR